jgi:type IV pilus assembly protein PilA
VRGLCYWRSVSQAPEAHPRRRQHGVSVIELILVVAATAVVVALGVSGYRTYSVRAQISSTLDGAGAARALVAAAFEQQGSPPLDAAATGIDKTAESLLMGKYLDSVSVDSGRIDLRFGSAADSAIAGETLSLTPYETADQQIVWICGNERPDVGLNPLGFAAGGPQAIHVVTSIEDRYLPSSCR